MTVLWICLAHVTGHRPARFAHTRGQSSCEPLRETTITNSDRAACENVTPVRLADPATPDTFCFGEIQDHGAPSAGRFARAADGAKWWHLQTEHGRDHPGLSSMGRDPGPLQSAQSRVAVGRPWIIRSGRQSSCRKKQERQNRSPQSLHVRPSAIVIDWISGHVQALHLAIVVFTAPPSPIRFRCRFY